MCSRRGRGAGGSARPRAPRERPRPQDHGDCCVSTLILSEKLSAACSQLCRRRSNTGENNLPAGKSANLKRSGIRGVVQNPRDIADFEDLGASGSISEVWPVHRQASRRPVPAPKPDADRSRPRRFLTLVTSPIRLVQLATSRIRNTVTNQV